MHDNKSPRPTIARIWRGRTTRERADEYEAYNYEVGITPLMEKALGVQTLREDRDSETEFVTISYWESVELVLGECRGDVALHRRRSYARAPLGSRSGIPARAARACGDLEDTRLARQHGRRVACEGCQRTIVNLCTPPVRVSVPSTSFLWMNFPSNNRPVSPKFARNMTLALPSCLPSMLPLSWTSW